MADKDEHISQLEGRIAELESELAQCKRAEKELNWAEDVLRAITETAEDSIFIKDRECRYTFVNPAMERTLGLSAEELLGKTPVEVFGAEDAAIVSATDEPVLAGEVVNVIRTLTVAGKDRTFHTVQTPVKSNDGSVRAICGIVRDVTEKTRAELALRESEERFRQIAEKIHEVFWIVSADWQEVYYVSPAYEQFWGRSCQSLYECPSSWAEALHPDDKEMILAAVEKKISGQDSSPTFPEHRIVRPDGTFSWMLAHTFPVMDPDGRKVRYVGVAEDITERKESQEQLQQALKMEAVGQLAGGVAHDFNNLLLAIIGHGGLLLEENTLSDAVRDDIETMMRAAQKAADLVNQLLAYSRRQMLHMKDVSLAETVAEVLKMIRRVIGEHIVIKTVITRDTSVVHADTNQLSQIMMNLCVNARDAMPHGGEILIKTENVDLDEKCCAHKAWAEPGSYAKLSVCDTGVGMDAETLSKIFVPFFTTKEVGSGTGLGLASVYGLVKQHKGLINVQSELDKGSTFEIYLPLVKHAPSKEADTPQDREVSKGRETILLAEDNELVLKLARRVLEAAGYTVFTATNGKEALNLFKKHNDTIDLALLDVVMPKMGGYALYEAMKAEDPKIRAIFMSGHNLSSDHLNHFVDKDLPVVRKPFERQEMLELIRQQLDKTD